MSISKKLADKLNKFQREGHFHPYTCMGHNGCNRMEQENDGRLVATKEGWVCPCGKYTQEYRNEIEFMTMPEQIIIGIEIVRRQNIINENLEIIRDINTNGLDSSAALNKINHQKKYIKALNFFNENNIALFRKREGIYTFYIDGEEYQYSPKTRKIKRPGERGWSEIRRRTLERVIGGNA